MASRKLLIFTTAPVDYDYGCNKVVVEHAGVYPSSRNNQVRLILGYDEYRADYQTGRYSSGMYFTRQGDNHDLIPSIQYGYFIPSPECVAWLIQNDYEEFGKELLEAAKEALARNE